MEIYTDGARALVGKREPATLTLASPAALRQWITAHEMEALREALGRGCLPPDFHRKLRGLAGGDLSDRFIEQNCRLFTALLLATEEGSFREGSRAERERLLRVLAYVRKDDDAIADYRSDGFIDDHRETRSISKEMASLLESFKAWRLRHQVPVMWPDHGERI